MNSNNHGEGSLKNFYGYKETFAKETTWVEVPSELKFVHTSNPYDDEEDSRYAAEGDTSFMMDGSGRYDDRGPGNEYELAQAAYPAYAAHGLEALSAVASQDQYSYAPPPAPMTQHEQSPHQHFSTSSPQQGQATTTQNLDFILNPTTAGAVPTSPSNIDPRLHSELPMPQPPEAGPAQHQSSEQVRESSSPSHERFSLHAKGPNHPHLDRSPALESPELAFLLRDFSERGGLWMDLFDLKLFFASTVPVLAVQCPLLLYSCVALSAKSLARVGGRKPVMGGQVTEARRSKMETWPGTLMTGEDWYHKAREYYDLAVSLLRQALAGASRPPSSSLPQHASPKTIFAAQGYPLPTTNSDELVAATAILCVYEFLDASGPEWSRHLDGAKSLFDIANDRMLNLTAPSSPVSLADRFLSRPLSCGAQNDVEGPTRTLSKGRRAVFWNFARQDMLSASINSTNTRLDTSDLAMWQNAGVRLTAEGYVCPSNPNHPDFESQNAMQDDMVCNAFIWLLAKLVNFIAAGDDVPPAVSSPLGLGVRQKELLEYWEGLEAQLNAWYEGLPDSFQATAVHPAESNMSIEEKWFPRPMCASAMQWWHFARIQLLHNKPHLTTASTTTSPNNHTSLSHALSGASLAARHASYTSILQQSRSHAKEIVAIGLGRSDEGTRIHSVQPLWTAGLVLGSSKDGEGKEETWMWRRSIISQLRGIERDMGWASEYRVRSLLDLWELPSGWGLDGDG